MVKVLQDHCSNWSFYVFADNKKSLLRLKRNGLPLGSVLASVLFNCYTYGIPSNRCRKVLLADDCANGRSSRAEPIAAHLRSLRSTPL